MVVVEPQYCHQCGTELARREVHGRTRKVCSDCGFRHFLNAVPAVDVVVRGGRDVLLMDPVSKDDWELPGGHPEAEEEPIDAAVRELCEETGVEAESSDLELLTVTRSEHLDRQYNVITYLLDFDRATGEVTPGAKAQAVEFWTLDRVLSSPAETRQIDREVLGSILDR